MPRLGRYTLPFRSSISFAAALSMTLGLLALLGWITGLPELAAVNTDWILMAPSTAVFFLLFGGVLLLKPDESHELSRIRFYLLFVALLTAAAGALLVLSLLGLQLPLERLGIEIEGTHNGAPLGHMSPVTAACFVLAGASLILLLGHTSLRRGFMLTGALLFAFLLYVVTLALLIAYAGGRPLLYGSRLIPPALTTATGFFFLTLALFGAFVRRRREARPATEEGDHETQYRDRYLWIGALASALLLALGVLVIRGYLAEERRIVAEDLVNVAELKVDELVQWRRERIGDGSVFHRNVQFAQAVEQYRRTPERPEAREALLSWLAGVRKAYGYRQVTLLDRNAELLLSEPRSAEPLMAPEEAEAAISGRTVQLIDFHRDGPGEEAHLTVLVPIVSEADELLGALTLEIDPSRYLYPLLGRWPAITETAETFLVRREGEQVLFLSELRFRDDAPLNYRLPLTRIDLPSVKAVHGILGTVQGLDYRGEPVIAVLRQVPQTPWFLIAKVDLAEVYSPIMAQLFALVGVLLALLSAILGVVWAGRQRRAKAHFRELYELEVARKENETRYQTILRSIGDGIIVTDTTGTIELMNEAAEKLTGRLRDEAVGRAVTEVYRISDEKTGRQVEDPVAQILRSGSAVSLASHAKLTCRHGKEILISESGAPIWDEEATVTGVVFVFRDETAEREAERKMRESEERFRLTLEHSNITVATCDTELRYTWIHNPHRGFSPEEAIGRRDDELDRNEGIDRLLALKRAVLASGDAARREIAFPLAEGERIYEINAQPIFGEGGAITGVTTVAVDITERKELEQRYAGLFNGIWDAILVANTDREIVDCNPAFRELFGYTLDELRGQPTSFVYASREEYEKMGAKLKDHMGDPSFRQVITYKKKSEETFRGETYAYYLRDSTERVVGFVGVVQDVTERELMERELIEAQKMEALGQIAGGIAHDFNNVLAAVDGASQMLEHFMTDESLNRHVKTIRSSVKRGESVTNRLLSFVRSSEPEKRSLILGSFLSEFSEAARHTLPQHVHLEIRDINDTQRVYADPGQLQQVLFTLCINAADAMPEGGRIRFKARTPTAEELREHLQSEIENEGERNEYWCLEVSDDGVGMDGETQQRLFEPFFTTKGTEGTGLGLAVAYKIAKLHNGWIDVSSAPGQGTTFTLGLPAAGEATEEVPETEALIPGEGERILIVDDEESIRNALVEALTRNGYWMRGAGSAEEALELLKVEPVDLVITDIGLPDMNGKRLIMKLKAEYPAMPIIAMTGYVEANLEETLFGAGANAVVGKPYDIHDLSRQIRSLITGGT